MDWTISFVHTGKRSRVPVAVYNEGKDILLPDGTLLRPQRWRESHPPILDGVKKSPTCSSTWSSQKRQLASMPAWQRRESTAPSPAPGHLTRLQKVRACECLSLLHSPPLILLSSLCRLGTASH